MTKPEEFTEKVLAFLGEMGVTKVTRPKFYVEVNFNTTGNPSSVYWGNKETVFRLKLRSTEWELTVSSPKKESRARWYAEHPTWIAKDDLGLFKKKPRVDQIPSLLRAAEKKLGVEFPRVVWVGTNIAGAKKAVREWAEKL